MLWIRTIRAADMITTASPVSGIAIPPVVWPSPSSRRVLPTLVTTIATKARHAKSLNFSTGSGGATITVHTLSGTIRISKVQ